MARRKQKPFRWWGDERPRQRKAVSAPTGGHLYAQGFREVKGWNVRVKGPVDWNWRAAYCELARRSVSGRNPEVWN